MNHGDRASVVRYRLIRTRMSPCGMPTAMTGRNSGCPLRWPVEVVNDELVKGSTLRLLQKRLITFSNIDYRTTSLSHLTIQKNHLYAADDNQEQ